MIAIDVSKQQALDAYPKAIQQINFTRNVAPEGNTNTAFFSLLEKQVKLFYIFHQEL